MEKWERKFCGGVYERWGGGYDCLSMLEELKKEKVVEPFSVVSYFLLELNNLKDKSN